jgi:hypothetical protein
VRTRGALALALLLAASLVPAATAGRRRTTLPPPPHLPQSSEVDRVLGLDDLARRRLGQGLIRLTVRNRGEDDHDLTILAGSRVVESVFVAPGATGTIRALLAPGRYRLVCTIADHRALGMETILRIG